MTVIARAFEFVVCVSGGVAVIVAVFSIIGWLTSDDDEGGETHQTTPRRNCNRPTVASPRRRGDCVNG